MLARGDVRLPKVVHFEIPAENPERADFYKKVFGWKIEKWMGRSTTGS